MYFIHPNHVNVRLPQDRSDDELVLSDNELTIGSQPTGMTYFLERIRLAHLCREMVDVVPRDTCKLFQMPYEQIIRLDRKLKDFISNLPFFFRLDPESRQKSKPLEVIYPNIPIMRYSITKAAHSRRCKLHQRFLLRQAHNPRYSYSRQACLESARVVLQGYEDLSREDFSSYDEPRMGIAMHYIHLALVVMVMDVCFNKDEIDEAERKAEVQAALEKFGQAKATSPLLCRYLHSLCNILTKHGVCLPASSTSTINHEATFDNAINPNSSDATVEDQMQTNLLEFDTDDPDFFKNSLDEFWDFTVQNEPNLDVLSWDNLFSTLDSRPI